MTRLTCVHAPTPAVACLATLAGLLGLLPAQVIQTALAPIPINLTSDMAMHVANRATFGQTEALVTALTGSTNLATTWINSQLAPNFPADNLDVASLLALLNVPAAPIAVGANHTFGQIKDGAHVYSAASDFQLAARMAYFWDRHFNTFGPFVSGYVTVVYGSGNPTEGENITSRLEWIDYEFYRQNGLGTFRDLARHTFFSPAMMIYLDTIVNQCNNVEPNENMAREFMELHTVGPVYAPTGVANYGTNDIDTVAKVMAGWHLNGNGNGYAIPLVATFYPALNCNFNTSIFGTPAIGAHQAVSGPTAIDALIDHLVASEACKDFICRKLMNEFLGDGSDLVYPPLLTAMKNLWGTQGNLQAVMGRLLKSGEFLAAGTKWTRAKTPFESAISHMRMWNGSFKRPSNGALEANRVTYLRNHTENIGESLFGYPTPDGFDLESNHQPGSSVTLLTFRLFSESYYTKSVAVPPRLPYENTGGLAFALTTWVTATLGAPANQDPIAIGTLFLTRAYGSKWTSTDLVAVSDSLSRDVNGALQPINPANPNSYAERLGQGVMATMSMNQGLLR
ncbi:MAG: DUF1800 family protein [Planctomycetota bacterium]